VQPNNIKFLFFRFTEKSGRSTSVATPTTETLWLSLIERRSHIALCSQLQGKVADTEDCTTSTVLRVRTSVRPSNTHHSLQSDDDDDDETDDDDDRRGC